MAKFFNCSNAIYNRKNDDSESNIQKRTGMLRRGFFCYENINVLIMFLHGYTGVKLYTTTQTNEIMMECIKKVSYYAFIISAKKNTSRTEPIFEIKNFQQ